MTTRRRLPNRRAHEIREFQFRGLAYIAGIGRYQDGALAEVFLECSKGQSQLAADARDAAVCLSIALQHGVSPEAIRSAVTRESDSSPSGIVGAVLDLIAGEARLRATPFRSSCSNGAACRSFATATRPK